MDAALGQVTRGMKTVGEVARIATERLGRDVSPAKISAIVYTRKIPLEECPLVGRSRYLTPAGVDMATEAVRAVLAKRQSRYHSLDTPSQNPQVCAHE